MACNERRISQGPSEPIVTDPPGMDVAAAWRECREHSDRMFAAGREIAAAAGADPGICSCPACQQMYWAWGWRQRCRGCGFEYPTDAWAMYSCGVQAANGGESYLQLMADYHARRLAHPYYRYGFDHPVEDAWEEYHRIDWRAVMGGQAT